MKKHRESCPGGAYRAPNLQNVLPYLHRPASLDVKDDCLAIGAQAEEAGKAEQ